MDRKFQIICIGKKRMIIYVLLAALCVEAFLTKADKAWAKETQTADFTEEQQDYIDRKKVIKAVSVPDYRPIAAKDETDGTYQGLAIDILNKLGEQTGLEIEYIEADSYKSAMQMLEEGGADIVTVAAGYSYSENLYEINLTEPYLNSQMMMLHSKSISLRNLPGYNIAEVAGYPVLSQNPAISHLQFSTPEDCILAIRSGHADVMYCDTFTGTNHLRQYGNRDMVFLPVNIEIQFRFGVSKSEEAVLTELLNDTIAGMSRWEINDSLTYNQRAAVYSLGDFVYYYPFEIICVILTVALLSMLVFGVYTKIKSRQSIATYGYAKSYAMLADMFGEAGLSYGYMEDKMTIFGKYADKLAMPSEIESFSAYLEDETKGISLTKQQFEWMLQAGMEGKAYDIDLKCRLKSGEWQHFRLIFSIISTEESYKRPICMMGCLTNTEEEYQEKKKLKTIGFQDNLTGLFNRAGAENAIRARMQSDNDITRDVLLILDVDYFKSFNDKYGHKCGDDVLRCVGAHLVQIFRKEDILCRWGGDEFLLYIIGLADYAEAIEERCIALQAKMREYMYENEAVPVTISIGGAAVGENSFEETFKEADKALYRVKEEGRDSIYIITDMQK